MNKINLSQANQKSPGSVPGKQTLDKPAVYELTVARTLSTQWATWFDGLDITNDEQGNTRISGIIVDQAALHGVLAKIRDLNLILISVRRM